MKRSDRITMQQYSECLLAVTEQLKVLEKELQRQAFSILKQQTPMDAAKCADLFKKHGVTAASISVNLSILARSMSPDT